MAKYMVTRKCGHMEKVEIYGQEKEREWKRRGEETALCKTCEEISGKERTKELQEAAAEDGLPPLEGSEKQVAWAVEIRETILTELKAMRGKFEATLKQQYKDDFLRVVDEWINPIRRQSSAKWWIDNREMKPRDAFMKDPEVLAKLKIIQNP